MAMKEEQGMRRAMLGWWAFLCSCLTTGSEEGLLEEGLDLSLVAGVSTCLPASLPDAAFYPPSHGAAKA